MAGASGDAAPRDGTRDRTVRRDGWYWGIGSTAVLLWGAFFDQLSRVGRWMLDTSLSPRFHTLADLHFRLRDAHNFLTREHLYGFRRGAFTYPPVTAALFAPLRAIGEHAAMVAWTMATVAALAALLALTLWRFCSVRPATAWLAAGAGLAPATIIVLYPFHSHLLWGQLGVFIMLAVFCDLFMVPPRFRGLLIGAVTAVKLLPGIFVVWFVLRREIPAVLRAAGTFVVMTALAWLYWPHASAHYWLHLLPSGKDVDMVIDPTNANANVHLWYFGLGKTVNQSLRGLLARPPMRLHDTFPWIVIALAVLALGLYVTWRLLRQRRELVAFMVLSLVTVLVAPVSWLHYWVFAGLAPYVAVSEWRRDRPTAIAAIILAVSVCANVEDVALLGFPPDGPTLVAMWTPVLLAVRSLYVLGGLVFLGVVTWRALRGGLEERDLATELSPPSASR